MLVFRRVWHPCHTHAVLLLILPQKPQNAQKFLAEKSIPQTHRRRVWHPCHTHAALLLILPRKPQNSQKFLAEKSLPQTYRRRVWHPAIPTQPSCLSSHGSHKTGRSFWRRRASHRCTRMSTLSLQKNTTQSHKLQNDQGKTMIAKDSFVPLL